MNTLWQKRNEFSIANLNSSDLFISGGILGGQGSLPTATVVRFDLNEMIFYEETSMNVARYSHSSTAMAGSVYVFGGKDGSKCLASIEVLDTLRQPDCWQNLDF